MAWLEGSQQYLGAEHSAVPSLLSRKDPVGILTPWLQGDLDLQAMINTFGRLRPSQAGEPMPGATFQPTVCKTWETGENCDVPAPCFAGVATNESWPGCGSGMGTSATNDAVAATSLTRLANED
ncbi:hypothetical protein TrVFT333_000979 [Trichoderma virens FT-333]|nr:hypothetical protein TrVFT333_000979 [Trichoderma virens FT-333]